MRFVCILIFWWKRDSLGWARCPDNILDTFGVYNRELSTKEKVLVLGVLAAGFWAIWIMLEVVSTDPSPGGDGKVQQLAPCSNPKLIKGRWGKRCDVRLQASDDLPGRQAGRQAQSFV
ncbi:hypothetical protein GUJ93_ZPchr0006g42053 [Zizania palustris]|uniref:Uncharacterized protein n=1 Tax=Zizania palustris TaxID=103762 RepID=A0A8J5T4W9_ZIZPA|nr:hypothetical protein GUJ93_ZPchr0006g42053 [Zizania palustris]